MNAPSKLNYISLSEFLARLGVPDTAITEKLHGGLEEFGVNARMPVRNEFLLIMKALLNNDPASVRDLFLDDMHYRYFERFVANKGIAKISEVIISPHYLGIASKRSMDDPFCGSYVLGINDFREGLFINEVPRLPHHTVVYNAPDHEYELGVTTDYDFKALFGYSKDLLNSCTISLGDEWRQLFRIQGEIVFGVSKYNIESLVKDRYRGTLSRYLTYLVIDLLHGLLLDHGITMTDMAINELRNEARFITIRLSPFSWDEIDEYEITEILRNILGKYFKIESVMGMEIVLEVMDMKAHLTVSINPDNNEIRIYTRLDNLESTPLFNTIVNDLIRSIEETINTERESRVHVGNHEIELINATPLNFVYDPPIRPRYLPPINIEIYEPNTYIVTPKTVIRVRQTQHGEKEFKFDDTYLLQIQTTNIAPCYVWRRNLLAIMNLLPDHETITRRLYEEYRRILHETKTQLIKT